MPDEDFFQRRMSEFSQHRALAQANAGRDARAESLIDTAEYELAQAHRALTNVLQAMKTSLPDAAAIAGAEATCEQEPVQSEDAAAA